MLRTKLKITDLNPIERSEETMMKFPGLLLARQPRIEGEDIGEKKNKKPKVQLKKTKDKKCQRG